MVYGFHGCALKLNQWLSLWSLLLNLNNGSYIIAGSYLPFVIAFMIAAFLLTNFYVVVTNAQD